VFVLMSRRKTVGSVSGTGAITAALRYHVRCMYPGIRRVQGRNGMPRSALIVDDSRTAQVALSRLLKEQGIAADTVESGPEALNYLRSNGPGVIFLDHMMPGMDGFETLAALKSNTRTASIR